MYETQKRSPKAISPLERPVIKKFWNITQDIPPTKITIHHPFDNMLHFNHKSNIVLRKINAVIRLIFKNTKDPNEPKN